MSSKSLLFSEGVKGGNRAQGVRVAEKKGMLKSKYWKTNRNLPGVLRMERNDFM